ncbi:tyrosine/phenylalanine carboxypeptidase domain-containing protein [Ilumatobacter sp.]|uniref:tyrosine/phenylalanine carboxypeptidase domain-containing protein n=1 Tax=Ilumatobacter sp. TaxID=1967498 RepID=UPI003B523893
MSVDAPAPDSITASIDAELFEIQRDIDWLARVSPLDNNARWEAFRASDFARCPPLTYPEFDLDTDAVSARLDALAIDDIAQPTFRVLLSEKRTELERLVTLLESRDTPAFTSASMALFGGSDPGLLADAVEILETVEEEAPTGPEVGSDVVVAAAVEARDRYRAIVPDFDFRIELVDDADAIMLVHQGDLVIDSTLRIPHARVAPLVAHEVGVHVITRYNGRRQPLRLFESGFAHYDVLQEGLATFCEFLAGCLPPTRLRVLAARVVAADLAIAHEPIEEIFDVLHRHHGLGAEPAFDVAVRAKRGGGLTKDAVYLAGLRDLLAWLADGGDIEQVFLGKYSLTERHLVSDLLEEGLLVPPAILPTCLAEEGSAERLAAAVATPVTRLYQTEFPS